MFVQLNSNALLGNAMSAAYNFSSILSGWHRHSTCSHLWQTSHSSAGCSGSTAYPHVPHVFSHQASTFSHLNSQPILVGPPSCRSRLIYALVCWQRWTKIKDTQPNKQVLFCCHVVFTQAHLTHSLTWPLVTCDFSPYTPLHGYMM